LFLNFEENKTQIDDWDCNQEDLDEFYGKPLLNFELPVINRSLVNSSQLSAIDFILSS
jgi:hypothetical protein